MAPETATTKPWCTMFLESYVKKHLVLVAVDEAHCISDWSVRVSSRLLPSNHICDTGVTSFVHHFKELVG